MSKKELQKKERLSNTPPKKEAKQQTKQTKQSKGNKLVRETKEIRQDKSLRSRELSFKPQGFLAPSEAMRLNKAIASTGYCSRRTADALIFAGKVLVNNLVILNPAERIGADAKIEIENKQLERKIPLFYFLLNKPIECVCTVHDPEGRCSVLDFLPHHLRQYGLYPVGRLDWFSEGALILTNDGAWAQKILHPRNEKHKIYQVLIRGQVADIFLRKIKSGLMLKDGTKLLPVEAKAEYLKESQNTLLTLTLHQGINRQIRRMCADFDLVILKLKRIAIGKLELGNLKSGEIRQLTNKEIEMLAK